MKNKQQTMNKQQRTRRAFTLIELVVSVALLGIIFLFAGIIFKVSINSYRTAIANTEIMQKLRAITDQLDADFEGALLNAGGIVVFSFPEVSVIDGQPTQVRSDRIIIFANGDFQSTQQYGKTVVGNVATIFYGLADVSAVTANPREKVLTRRQTILTSDSSLPDANSDPRGEYYKKSLSEWKASPPFSLSDPNDWVVRLTWDPNSWAPNDLVKYMARGVDDFTIQYVGTDNSSVPRAFNDWRPNNNDITAGWAGVRFQPVAFKFGFTLYDSRNIIKKGRKFTHIVYLRN